MANNNTSNGSDTMNAKQMMEAKIAAQSTETLLDIARQLNLQTSKESIVTSTYVERELEKRLSDDDFLALMQEFEAAMDAEFA